MSALRVQARRSVIAYNAIIGPLLALYFVSTGDPLWALPSVLAGHAFWMYSTLVPHCAWFGEVVTSVRQLDPTAEPDTVWLTIDDGPHPDDTPALLELLDAHDAQATFFFIGRNAAAHPDLVQEVVARGHQVGNHTMTHPHYRFWAYGPSQVRRELAEGERVLTELAGRPVSFVRAPAGLKNPFVQAYLDGRGHRLIAWSARGLDGVSSDRDRILERIGANIEPGAIILVHEGRSDDANERLAPDVLAGVLSTLADRGLRCRIPRAT